MLCRREAGSGSIGFHEAGWDWEAVVDYLYTCHCCAYMSSGPLVHFSDISMKFLFTLWVSLKGNLISCQVVHQFTVAWKEVCLLVPKSIAEQQASHHKEQDGANQ